MLVLNHNHEFVSIEQRHLLRYLRNVSTIKGIVIVNVGITVTKVLSYLEDIASGSNKLGLRVRHMKNLSRFKS